MVKFLTPTVALIFALLIAVVFGIIAQHRLNSAQEQIAKEKAEQVLLADKNFQLEASIALQKMATAILTRRLSERTQEVIDLKTSHEEIDNAPDSEDGFVADVLCRAINGTRCVQPDRPNDPASTTSDR